MSLWKSVQETKEDKINSVFQESYGSVGRKKISLWKAKWLTRRVKVKGKTNNKDMTY